VFFFVFINLHSFYNNQLDEEGLRCGTRLALRPFIVTKEVLESGKASRGYGNNHITVKIVWMAKIYLGRSVSEN
jgi:hypothetical protein